MNKAITIFIVLLLIIANFSAAYATNLFDSKRGAKTAEKKVQKPVKAKPKVTNVTYKLVAVSKLANKYNLTFENTRKRNKVHTKWEKGGDIKDSPIPNYYIYDVVNRRVLFKAVDNKKFRCHESKKEKVTCDAKNKIIAYELVTSRPVRTASIGNNTSQPNQAANKKRKNNNKKRTTTVPNKTKQPFQPRRIEKQDIPDDMRLIKTPFGDRLVPK